MFKHQEKEFVRWFEEVWNEGKEATIHEMMDANCVIHDGDQDIRGPEEFKLFHAGLRAAFNDFRVVPHHAFSEGEWSCVRWTSSMTHIESGKRVQITGITVAQYRDGRFCEAWQNWDKAGLMAQLGTTAAAG
jgi:predicted ester cyclase